MFTHRSVLGSSLVVVVLSILIAACSAAPPPQPREEAFWQWFQKNDLKLYDFEANQNALFDQLEDQLHKVDSHLTFEFGQKKAGKREFVISAGGIRSAFPAVITLADKAPKLPRWKIVKFRQRHFTNGTIDCQGVEVAAKDIYFSIEPKGKLADVTLFIKGYDGSDAYKQIGFLWLDSVLGEYDVETKLGAIDFKPLGPDKARQAKPLVQLAASVDALAAQK